MTTLGIRRAQLTLASENLEAKRLDLDPSSREPLERLPQLQRIIQWRLHLERHNARRVLVRNRLLLLLAISACKRS